MILAVQIGDFPDRLLEAVTRQAGVALGLEVAVAAARLDPRIAYDERRGQFLAHRLLQELKQTGDRVVGAASVDLFNPILTFVFGEAELPGRAAVFSIHRLRQEFYGLPADPTLLAERAAKEMIHEIGHTFGLAHCPDAACVMSSSHSVEAVDRKTGRPCARCRHLTSWL